jgi:hypothetical protein
MQTLIPYRGITSCSPPTNLYWFNPVAILLDELLAGATISLPADINSTLNLVKITSNLVYGFFITGVVLNFVSVFLTPLALYSRWISLPLAIFTFLAALLTTAAAVIATVLWTIFRNVVTSQPGLNIKAELGAQMFAFMWIGAVFSIVGWIIQMCLGCCAASRRDVRTGRRRGDRRAYREEGLMAVEVKGRSGRQRWWRRRVGLGAES